MSIAESGKIEGILDELRNWPLSERLRLAHLILETIEPQHDGPKPRNGSLTNLLGILRTDGTPPNDEECRAILEDELIKKHLK
jgi:hypothetical protein